MNNWCVQGDNKSKQIQSQLDMLWRCEYETCINKHKVIQKICKLTQDITIEIEIHGM